MSLDFTALNNIQTQERKSQNPEPEAGGYRLLEADKLEKKRLYQIFSTYQTNTERASLLRNDIARELREGRPLPAILLKAIECISLITGDTVIYTQGKEDLLAIYGWGLEEPATLELELEEVTSRLAMLSRPELQDAPADAQEHIKRAITAHKQLIEQLERALSGEHEGSTSKGYEGTSRPIGREHSQRR